jgi:hypothetical protein
MADAYGELVRRVEADLARFAQRVGVGLDRLRGPVLDEQEAAGFLRAVDAGIVTLEPGGVCRLTGLSAMGQRKPYQLFSSYEGGTANPGAVLTWSWRELFTQIAFAAELVVDHGWPGRSVLLEVDRLDLAAGDPAMLATRPLLTAEAKVTDGGRAGLVAMMAVFAELNGTQAPCWSPGACTRTPRVSTGRCRGCAHWCLSRSLPVCAAPMTLSTSTMGASCSAGEAQSQVQTNPV